MILRVYNDKFKKRYFVYILDKTSFKYVKFFWLIILYIFLIILIYWYIILLEKCKYELFQPPQIFIFYYFIFVNLYYLINNILFYYLLFCSPIWLIVPNYICITIRIPIRIPIFWFFLRTFKIYCLVFSPILKSSLSNIFNISWCYYLFYITTIIKCPAFYSI